LRADFGLSPWGYSRNDSYELADLSFGGVYHPWLMVADDTAPAGVLRPVPPDGLACGQIALRERRRQVWVAPANQPLQGVLSVEKNFPADDRLALFQRNFNLAARDFGAFRFLSAHTQSDSRLWQQLSVRRLMILLRKIAAQRGMDYVFESNDERFRAGVQFALEELLLGMYERGAFAGRSPEQAFRVSTGPDVNPRQSVEQGRFVAQIQVAPSRPLEFITILLLRQGDGEVQAVEGG
jgi:phage tail sheath protein FI